LFEWQIETRSPEQTRALGACLGRELQAPALILLSGDLGAGKTCFTQGLAQGLAVAEDEPVVSPSYTLINHYRGRIDLYHFDFYRLSDADDLSDLGFDEYLKRDGVTVVEWGDRFPELALQGIHVDFQHGADERRMIRVSAEKEDDLILLERFRHRWLTQEVEQ